MIKKVIYIHETFYRKHRDMGIDVFRKKGYEVELWSNLKIKYKNKLEVPEDNTSYKVIYFENHAQLVREIYRQDWQHTIAFFTTTTHRGGIEDFARIAIGMAGGRYCNFMYEVVPVGNGRESKKKKEKRKSQWEMAKAIYGKYKLMLYQNLIKRYFKPAFCFVPSYQAVKNLLTEWEKEAVAEVHNKDYDEYLINGSAERKGGYILFMDGDMANAEDFKKNGTAQVYPESSVYYRNMDRLFSNLEKHYGIPVYIAAHPKAEYAGGEFGGRKIFYYQTCRLVQNADLVLTHASTAINFVMMYKKPYIFLVDRYVKKHMMWRYLTFPMIKELKAMTCHFDREEEPWKFVNQPDEKYEAYFKKYIKHANFNGKLFYEIVEEAIRGRR